MPLSTLERDTIARACGVAKQLLYDLQPKLAVLTHIYDSAGGLKTTVTQAELDEAVELSGLTKAQLDDGLYVLTELVGPALSTGYAALAQLAARNL